MMAQPSTGDTVNTTNTNNNNNNNNSTRNENLSMMNVDSENLIDLPRLTCKRKRRREEFTATTTTNTPCTEVPEKTQRRSSNDDENNDKEVFFNAVGLSCPRESKMNHVESRGLGQENNDEYDDVPSDATKIKRTHEEVVMERCKRSEISDMNETREIQQLGGKDITPWLLTSKRKKQEKVEQEQSKSISSLPHNQDATRRLILEGKKKDEAARLRKTIQWLDEGARRLREDLANVRTELHEERRAAKIAKREADSALREARAAEAAKYQMIIAELKNRLSHSTSAESLNRTSSPLPSAKAEFVKNENHRRELSVLKKRLAEAETTVRRLKWGSLNQKSKSACHNGSICPEVRRLEGEMRGLRVNNEKLEEKLRLALDAEKSRANELRIQHEAHEAALSALRKSLRSDTIKMMDELKLKTREIEKLSKLACSVQDRDTGSRKRRKTIMKENVKMRKLKESSPIRSKKFFMHDGHTVDSYIREVGCDGAITEVEVERLRELALEQQEVIEILRQAVKEKERKLEQLTNKKRKEEFYRQWLELEPVAEVDDEEDHEEGDSALSSAPSSLSPQPGGCGQWQGTGVTREAYEAVLIEVEELQTRLLEEKQESSRAKNEVRDLEIALLQETRCANRNKELNVLNRKLQETEEREANLLAELSELREQNELLEFRLLELEEMSARRESPDHTADSGVVSPEPMLIKDQSHHKKQINRAVATVIPYTSSNTSPNRSISPIPPKPPLSLQESGIFEQDEDDEAIPDADQEIDDEGVELANQGTQTEVPAGELLQEIQRLQELRVRIQERAAKVASQGPGVCAVVCPAVCANTTEQVPNFDPGDSIVQLNSYQERIRELEERLSSFQKSEEKLLNEKRISKQREEELLDENYRLTERVYWLENELRNIEERIKGLDNIDIAGQVRSVIDAFTSTEGDGFDAMEIQEKLNVIDQGTVTVDASTMTDDFSNKDNNNLRAQCKDTSKGINMLCSTAVQTTTDEVFVNSINKCAQCQTRDLRMRYPTERQYPQARPKILMDSVEEVAKEAKEYNNKEGENDDDEVDGSTSTSIVGRISQVHVIPEEQEIPQQPREVAEEESTGTVVTLTESEPEKKVRYKRNKESKSKEKEGWAMKTWNGNDRSFLKNLRCEKNVNRLVIYQELCV